MSCGPQIQIRPGNDSPPFAAVSGSDLDLMSWGPQNQISPGSDRPLSGAVSGSDMVLVAWGPQNQIAPGATAPRSQRGAVRSGFDVVGTAESDLAGERQPSVRSGERCD